MRYDAANQRASTQSLLARDDSRPNPHKPNVPSARSRRETASPVGAVRFSGRRPQVFAPRARLAPRKGGSR